jgi:hypothetical protein
MKKIITFTILTIISSVFLVQLVLAQGVQVAPNQTTGSTAGTVSNVSTSSGGGLVQSGELEVALPFIGKSPATPADYISGLYRIAIYAAIIAAIIMITIAGINYATSGANPSKQKEAMGQIQDAIIGLVLILASVLLLRTINPALVSLNLPGLNVQLGGEGLSEEKMKEVEDKLYMQCCKEICNKFAGDTALKCIDACKSLYQKATVADPHGCFSQCCLFENNPAPRPGVVIPNPCFTNPLKQNLSTLTSRGKYCAARCNYQVPDK